MVLAVADIGNTNITLGIYEDGTLTLVSRICTDPNKMSDQYAAEIHGILELHGKEPRADGAVICSVVPKLTRPLVKAMKLCFGADPIVVGPGVKNGLDIKTENPTHTGADLVASAVGALAEFETPLIVFDLGTATKATVLTEGSKFSGGVILPGVGIAQDALAERTAQLPHIGIHRPDRVIGTGTVECMQSGAVYGTAAMMDGLAERIEEELGQKCTIVATGGLSEEIVPCCRREMIHRPNLILDGLKAIYEKNA